MDAIFSLDDLRSIYEKAAIAITKRLMLIELKPGGPPMNGEFCTVYTSFARGANSGLAFCADKSLSIRMTKNMKRMGDVDTQDIEDYLKEYLNVLCGQIAREAYNEAHVAARFEIPEFHSGLYNPYNMKLTFELSFLSDKGEHAWLQHYRAEG